MSSKKNNYPREPEVARSQRGAGTPGKRGGPRLELLLLLLLLNILFLNNNYCCYHKAVSFLLAAQKLLDLNKKSIILSLSYKRRTGFRLTLCCCNSFVHLWQANFLRVSWVHTSPWPLKVTLTLKKLTFIFFQFTGKKMSMFKTHTAALPVRLRSTWLHFAFQSSS